MKPIVCRSVSVLSIATLSVGLASCGEAPAETVEFADIKDAMWESMEGAESVTVAMETPGDEGEVFGMDFGNTVTAGDLQNTASSITVGTEEPEEIIRVFGDSMYISAGYAILSGTAMMERTDADAAVEDLRSQYEGKWMELPTAAGGTQDMSPGDLIAEMRSGWDSEDVEGLPSQGQLQERDGQDVWVFSFDEEEAPEMELVVQADADAPRFVVIGDDESRMVFSDWNETDLPEEPTGEDLLDEGELDEAMMGVE